MNRLGVLLVLCNSAALAFAEKRVAASVRVGETVTTEVGYVLGFLCDVGIFVSHLAANDLLFTNLFAVTGLAVGTTLCRAGMVTVENRPSYLFEVTVSNAVSGSKPPAHPRRAARRARAPKHSMILMAPTASRSW